MQGLDRSCSKRLGSCFSTFWKLSMCCFATASFGSSLPYHVNGAQRGATSAWSSSGARSPEPAGCSVADQSTSNFRRDTRHAWKLLLGCRTHERLSWNKQRTSFLSLNCVAGDNECSSCSNRPHRVKSEKTIQHQVTRVLQQNLFALETTPGSPRRSAQPHAPFTSLCGSPGVLADTEVMHTIDTWGSACQDQHCEVSPSLCAHQKLLTLIASRANLSVVPWMCRPVNGKLAQEVKEPRARREASRNHLGAICRPDRMCVPPIKVSSEGHGKRREWHKKCPRYGEGNCLRWSCADSLAPWREWRLQAPCGVKAPGTIRPHSSAL